MPPAPHRADKDVFVEEVVRKANAVAQDRTLRKRAGRVHGDHPNLLVFFAVEFYEPGDDAALSHAGRTGKADGDGLAGVWIELGDHARNLRVLTLDLRDDPRQRPPVTGEQPFYQLVLAHLPYSLHALHVYLPEGLEYDKLPSLARHRETTTSLLCFRYEKGQQRSPQQKDAGEALRGERSPGSEEVSL